MRQPGGVFPPHAQGSAVSSEGLMVSAHAHECSCACMHASVGRIPIGQPRDPLTVWFPCMHASEGIPWRWLMQSSQQVPSPWLRVTSTAQDAPWCDLQNISLISSLPAATISSCSWVMCLGYALAGCRTASAEGPENW